MSNRPHTSTTCRISLTSCTRTKSTPDRAQWATAAAVPMIRLAASDSLRISPRNRLRDGPTGPASGCRIGGWTAAVPGCAPTSCRSPGPDRRSCGSRPRPLRPKLRREPRRTPRLRPPRCRISEPSASFEACPACASPRTGHAAGEQGQHGPILSDAGNVVDHVRPGIERRCRDGCNACINRNRDRQTARAGPANHRHDATDLLLGCDPLGAGRVDSPPMSIRSAPSAAISSNLSTAAPVSTYCPPSLKLSGVTLRMPMMRQRPPNASCPWDVSRMRGLARSEARLSDDPTVSGMTEWYSEDRATPKAG